MELIMFIEKSKEKRIELFKNLAELFEQYKSSQSMLFENAVNFTPTKFKPSVNYDLSTIKFSEDNVINSIENNENPAVLIFASAKNPGGGILNGSFAQEETISLHSSWYFQAKENHSFYSPKGESALNTDNISIANGFLLTNQYYQHIDPKPVLFIACAAPNLNGLLSQQSNINEIQVYEVLDKRIKNILITAENNKSKHLILGAFGCGVFGLEPTIVAQIFKKNIHEGYYTGTIEFCILNKYFMNCFQNIFHTTFVNKKHYKNHN